jgi:hypothetical protein
MRETDGEVTKVRPGSRVLPFLLVVGVCLAAGIWLGSIAGGGLSSAARAGEASEAFVFLGYDDLQSPTRLTAIWVLELDGRGKASYLGLSPSTIILAKDGQAAVLRDLLVDPRAAPARLYQVDRIPNPSTAVEFDNHALAMIINRMGGIRLDGRPLRGQDVIALAAAESDPVAQLRLQSRIVTALFGINGPCLGEAAYAGLDPEHLVSTKPSDVFVAECVQRGPYLEDAIRVEVLDTVEKIDLPDGSIGLWPISP